MKQFVLTPAMGKRLIAKALLKHPAVGERMSSGRLVIIAGTTNAYVAEEVLGALGQVEGFARKGFRRGMTLPPGVDADQYAAEFAGDVVIEDGQWRRGEQIFDVVDDLAEGDVVLKGANAVNLQHRNAGVYIGHPKAGTIGATVQAIVGRRVRLIVPVGLEKRIVEPIDQVAGALNAPGASGPRMMPLPGEVFTELEALSVLSGAEVRLLAGGGVYGAEGCVYLGVSGSPGQQAAAEAAAEALGNEPLCDG